MRQIFNIFGLSFLLISCKLMPKSAPAKEDNKELARLFSDYYDGRMKLPIGCDREWR